MKKPEPIKATYHQFGGDWGIHIKGYWMTFNKPLTPEQIAGITAYLAGEKFLTKGPGRKADRIIKQLIGTTDILGNVVEP